MAEVAGLALGVLALAGSFKECVELVSCISAARSMGRDYQVLAAKIDVERILLLQWAKQTKLLEKDAYDRRLDDATTRTAVAGILAHIKLLVNDSSSLTGKYGLQKTEQGGELVSQPLSDFSLDTFRHKFNKLTLDLRHDGRVIEGGISPFRRLQWAIHDKAKCENLIQDLSYFVSKLQMILPQSPQVMHEMSLEDVEHIPLIGLQILESALDGHVTPMAKAATTRLQKRLEQAVLDSIWFDAIDDRRVAIECRHGNTFDWALNPFDTNCSWHSLVDWFKYGDGLYWISGKPASGKSTLMKFLFFNHETEKMLKQWAGQHALIMESYFLWNVGTEDQKSQSGLRRALLFYILNHARDQIPSLLPRMWREAQRETFNGNFPGPPTSFEIRQAFDNFRALPDRKHKYCFFLDGLDELAGDYSEGISLVQFFASIPNFKVIVSSRPIPTCVAAFSMTPQLRLQDLTIGDIRRYVNDRVVCRPQMSTLMQKDADEINRIAEEIVTKASGVWLWVVLACKSVREGLADFDTPAELWRCVQELPPQIETLIEQIFARIKLSHRREGAKLLKLRYFWQLVEEEDSMSALGMSLANDYMVSLAKDPVFKILTPNHREARGENLEGRLRSRCLGLLEVHRRDDKLDGVPSVRVEFMHRTVFEFMQAPGTLNLPCLDVGTAQFDPFAILSWMRLHLAHHTAKDKRHLAGMFRFAAHAKESSFSTIHALLGRCMSLEMADLSNSYLTDRSASVALALPIVAVELGWKDFVQQYLQSPAGSALEAHGKGILLMHCLVPSLALPVSFDAEARAATVEALLRAGCAPNEKIEVQFVRYPSTPWLLWIRSILTPDRASTDAGDPGRIDCALMKTTRLLIDAGAKIADADEVLQQPLEQFFQHKWYSLNLRSPRQIKERESLLRSTSAQRKAQEATNGRTSLSLKRPRSDGQVSDNQEAEHQSKRANLGIDRDSHSITFPLRKEEIIVNGQESGPSRMIVAASSQDQGHCALYYGCH